MNGRWVSPAPPGPDATFVVEELDRASCAPAIKALAVEGFAAASLGGTSADWRARIASHANHEWFEARLGEAERCMRTSGIWPWNG